jgi:hypothetical protein
MICRPMRSIALILLATACRKPTALPTFEQALNQAAGTSEAQVAEAQRPDYRDGFLNGARMIQEAVKAGKKPFMPRMGKGPSVARPLGPLPEGATIIEDDPPTVEMDPETGLQIRFVHPDFTAAFARGQVDGFQWALARHPADLIHPKALPNLPDSWQAWPEKGPVSLAGTGMDVDLVWTPRLLAWSIRERGFPSKRTWRPVPAWVHPSKAALTGDAFWIDSEKGVLGLDLDTGAIRRVEAVQPRLELPSQDPWGEGEPSEAVWKAFQQRERAKVDAERGGNLEAVAKGDSEAMLKLGWGSEDLAEGAGWFRKAAEHGNAQGMYEWGVRLYQGRGVPENREEARTWFEKAVQAGHPSAAEVIKGLFATK